MLKENLMFYFKLQVVGFFSALYSFSPANQLLVHRVKLTISE